MFLPNFNQTALTQSIMAQLIRNSTGPWIYMSENHNYNYAKLCLSIYYTF